MLTKLQDQDLELSLCIRQFERTLLDLFSRGKLHGTTHTCLGQEYIPVALTFLLQEHDFILSNHRGHGHYLARFRDFTGLLAEIMGREGAICNGMGGSQHIYRNGYLSTGIEGESLPVAVGIALHMKKERIPALTVVYIGDGTWGEGAVYEALNMAQLWQVPLLVIVENNGIAQSTPLHMHMAGTIEGRARSFGIDYLNISSLDINLIRTILSPICQKMRAKPFPFIVEFETYRLGPHSKSDDTRDDAEMARVRAMDWFQHYYRYFPSQYTRLETSAREYIAHIVAEVDARSLLDESNL